MVFHIYRGYFIMQIKRFVINGTIYMYDIPMWLSICVCLSRGVGCRGGGGGGGGGLLYAFDHRGTSMTHTMQP